MEVCRAAPAGWGRANRLPLATVGTAGRAATEDIAHQRQTLRNLVRHGEDTTEAVRSIGILEHTHLALVARSACQRVGSPRLSPTPTIYPGFFPQSPTP